MCQEPKVLVENDREVRRKQSEYTCFTYHIRLQTSIRTSKHGREHATIAGNNVVTPSSFSIFG
jgi:hypothetical protein